MHWTRRVDFKTFEDKPDRARLVNGWVASWGKQMYCDVSVTKNGWTTK